MLIFLFSLSTGSHAQYETSSAQLAITMGEIATIPHFQMAGTIGSDKTGVYLYGEMKDKPHLVKFGPDLTYQLDVPLDLNLNPSRSLEILKYILKEGRLFVYYEEHNRSNFEKTFELYMQEYDVTTLQKMGNPALLCMNRAEKARYFLDSEMKYFFPNDHWEFVVAYQDTVDGEDRQIKFNVFDYGGKKLHSLETPPGINRMGYLMSVKSNPEGKLFLAYGYNFLYVFDRTGKLESSIDMKLPDIALANRGELLMDEQENKYFSYVHYNPAVTRVTGFITQKIDKDQNTETFIVPITQEYVLLNQGRASFRNAAQELTKYGQAGLPNLKFLKRKILPDGSLIMAYETLITVKKWSKEDSQSFYEDTYGDIHVIKLKPSGELDWIRKIPKLQTPEVGDRLTSAYVHWNNGETFIFMSDNPANNKDMAVEIPVSYSANSKDVTLVHISADGQVNRNALFPKKDPNTLFAHSKWMMEDDGQLIMSSIKTKYVQLFRFEFK